MAFLNKGLEIIVRDERERVEEIAEGVEESEDDTDVQEGTDEQPTRCSSSASASTTA
jgi:hypothetical protein